MPRVEDRDRDEYEDDDPQPRKRRRRPVDDDDDEEDDYSGDGGVSTLIPYKNSKALIAYYCGVFSLIPCLGNILGPVALVFGILGKRYATEHPTAKGGGHAIAGIILGIFTILLYWVAPLAFGLIGTIVSKMK